MYILISTDDNSIECASVTSISLLLVKLEN